MGVMLASGCRARILLDHPLAADVVGQAAEGLGADDVVVAALHQFDHFGGEQPALPHLGAQPDDALGLFHQLPEGARRIVAVFAHERSLQLSPMAIQPGQQHIRPSRPPACCRRTAARPASGWRCSTPQSPSGPGRLTSQSWLCQELLQVVVAQGGVFHIDLPHDPHLDLGVPVRGMLAKSAAIIGEFWRFISWALKCRAFPHPGFDLRRPSARSAASAAPGWSLHRG